MAITERCGWFQYQQRVKGIVIVKPLVTAGVTAGSEALDSLNLLFSGVTKVMADSQFGFYGGVREKKG